MSEAELELRVQRLETALAELTRRVDGVGQAPSPVHAPSPVQAPSLHFDTDAAGQAEAPVLQDSPDWLTLAGFSVLIFGGAYLLRAFTESGVLPPVGGVIAGAVYA